MSILRFTVLEGVWLDGQDKFRLTKPFFYYVGDKSDVDNIVVPAGFTTDFASIPRFLWRIIGTPTSADYRNAAVLHDFLYCLGKDSGRSRKECDDIFYDAMTVLNVSWWKKNMIYRGVRLGGQSSYDEICNPLTGKS